MYGTKNSSDEILISISNERILALREKTIHVDFVLFIFGTKPSIPNLQLNGFAYTNVLNHVAKCILQVLCVTIRFQLQTEDMILFNKDVIAGIRNEHIVVVRTSKLKLILFVILSWYLQQTLLHLFKRKK